MSDKSEAKIPTVDPGVKEIAILALQAHWTEKFLRSPSGEPIVVRAIALIEKGVNANNDQASSILTLREEKRELVEGLKGMIEGRVQAAVNAVHPSKMFCHVCGRNSVVAVHFESCPVKTAEDLIAKHTT